MRVAGKIVLRYVVIGLLIILSAAPPSRGADSENISTAVCPLPEKVDSPLITVMWTGKGAERYEIQYKDSGIGIWKTWLIRESTENTYATFFGLPGRQYQFRSRGFDNRGRVEEWPLALYGDTQTEVARTTGQTLSREIYEGPTPLPDSKVSEKSSLSSHSPTCRIVTVADAGKPNQVLVSVLTRDNGIYEIQYNEKSGNTWKTWLRRKMEEGASAIFVALPGRSYAFRVRELTPSGKPSAWSEVREWVAPAGLAFGNPEKPPAVVEARNETPSSPETTTSAKSAPVREEPAAMQKGATTKIEMPVKQDVAGFSQKAGRISPALTRALPIASFVRVKTRAPAEKVVKIASHRASPSTGGLKRASLRIVVNRAALSLSHFSRTEPPRKEKTLPRASRPPSSQTPSPAPMRAPERPAGSLSSPRSDTWVELSIKPSDFKLSALPIRVGETVKISTLIRNSGNAEARQLVIEFLEDGKRFARGIIDAMPPAAIGELSARWTPSSPGRHVLTVLVAPPPDARESDRLDNKASITVTVNRQE